MKKITTTALALTSGIALLALAACGGDTTSLSDEPLKIWTPFNTPQRFATQKKVLEKFTADTGIKADLVGMSVPDMNQAAAAGAASGDLPDAAMVAPDLVASWNSQGLLDADASHKIVDTLGKDTFSSQALGLVTIDDKIAAVPSDGWGEMLFYRKDILAKHGIKPPTSIPEVVAAAEKIKAAGQPGIVLGTQPAEGFSVENLEHVGLAEGCQMFDGDKIALNSPACVSAVTAYQRMVKASVPGDQDVQSTRAAYLAGNAPMTFWSPHLLDEIAGLDDNYPLSCAECKSDPTFLAKNTGVVGGLTGDHNTTPTGMGATINLTVMKGADPRVEKLLTYLVSDGYIDLLEMGPEGRIPVRTGTPEEPRKYVEAWSKLELGGTESARKKPFVGAFDQTVVDEVVKAANGFSRWGFGTPEWAIAGQAYTQRTIVRDLNQLTQGGDPKAYADSITKAVEALK